ncbi:hypothetical protein Dimus_019978 [Dionaea muscipula]
MDLTSDAETLTMETSGNAAMIRRVFNIVRSSLIVVAAVMLLVALVGLDSSLVDGYSWQSHSSFVEFSVVLDSCTAMQEWANNPQAETALSDILPCVDERETNQTLIQSKKVVAWNCQCCQSIYIHLR